MSKSFNSLSTMLFKLDKVRNNRRVISNDDLFRAFGKDINKPQDGDYVTSRVSELKTAGFLEVHRNEKIFPPRRTHVTLTDKAMDVLEGRANASDKKEGNPPARNLDDDAMTLQEITDLIKAWNRQNRSWHIDPTPKYIDEEVPIGQR